MKKIRMVCLIEWIIGFGFGFKFIERIVLGWWVVGWSFFVVCGKLCYMFGIKKV